MRLKPILLLAGLVLAGCPRDIPRADAPRPRVVSFSPALTAMLFEMGLGDHIVGVTSFCTLPPGVEIPVVGSQLNIRAEPIVAVEPDVLLTQSAPTRFETVRKLKPDIKIEHFRIKALADVGDAMVRIAAVLGRPDKGRKARRQFQAGLDKVRRRVAGRPRPRVIFVTGHHSPLVAGRDTFMNELIEVAGGVNAPAEKYAGWKRIGVESILKLAPDVIVCKSQAADANEARRYWEALARSLPRTLRVYVVTDHRWTVPTARLADPIASQLADFIHPETRGGAKP